VKPNDPDSSVQKGTQEHPPPWRIVDPCRLASRAARPKRAVSVLVSAGAVLACRFTGMFLCGPCQYRAYFLI
jgi:hypothetical protein